MPLPEAEKTGDSALGPKVEIYTSAWCGYCYRAKTLLDGKGLRRNRPFSRLPATAFPPPRGPLEIARG